VLEREIVKELGKAKKSRLERKGTLDRGKRRDVFWLRGKTQNLQTYNGRGPDDNRNVEEGKVGLGQCKRKK